jgi:hypothetical protein
MTSPRTGPPLAPSECLGDQGYVHVPGPLTAARFRALAESLGPVVLETAVRVDPSHRSYLSGTAAVPFHTDHPDVRFIGWLCLAQDAADGASCYIDGLDAARGLPQLEGIQLDCPPLMGLTPIGQRPLFTRRPLAIFYAPWLAAHGEAAALADLAEFRHRLIQTPVHEVRLAPGDAVFIDNRRMLHGRRALAAGSPRCLQRLWIADPE